MAARHEAIPLGEDRRRKPPGNCKVPPAHPSWLENYKDLKEAVEDICELNHTLLRRKEAPVKRARSAIFFVLLCYDGRGPARHARSAPGK
jgi:hypothetical protein